MEIVLFWCKSFVSQRYRVSQGDHPFNVDVPNHVLASSSLIR